MKRPEREQPHPVDPVRSHHVSSNDPPSYRELSDEELRRVLGGWTDGSVIPVGTGGTP